MPNEPVVPDHRADRVVVVIVAVAVLVAVALAWYTAMPIWAITIIVMAVASVLMLLSGRFAQRRR